MLVIISDLHLTDGSSGETINEKAFRIFRNRLSDMAYDASWRKKENAVSDDEEEYRPIEQIDILLLGDIIDMIRSEKWNNVAENIMPWSDERTDPFFDNLRKIADDVLENNKKSFEILKGISNGDITIPAAMTEASESEKTAKKIKYNASAERVSPKVNIYYMIGNHDWFLYIDDARMHSIRNDVIDALGLSNEKNKPFPYYPHENESLLQTQYGHKVYAIHGDVFDETNYQDSNRASSSVGDVVVIKLLNEIPRQIEAQIGKYPETEVGSAEDVKKFVKQLREIDNLRPYSLAPEWITQVLKEYQLDVRFINDAIRDALRSLISDFTRNPIISAHHTIKIVMRLFKLLIGSSFSIEDLGKLLEQLSLDKDDFESYKSYAQQLSTEKLGIDKDFFVMGHTHYPEIVPLSSYMEDGKKRSKIYLNSGTWRALHKRALHDDSFISYKTMTIVSFYKQDERMGRPFEFWIGSLAL